MNASREEYFIRTFIRKSKQERLSYELFTPKKRYDGISRFCHQAGVFLDPSKTVLKGCDLESQPAFRDFISSHDELCAVISLEGWLDGETLSLKEAVDRASMSTDAVLILGSTFAIVFGEAEKGGREKYLLCE